MNASNADFSLEYHPGTDGDVEVRVSVFKKRLIGKTVQFYIEAEADVIGPDDPIHARRIIFSTEFEVLDTTRTFKVPMRALKMCPYQGSVVNIVLYGTLAIDAKPKLEKAIDLEMLKLSNLIPFGDVDAAIEHQPFGTLGAIVEDVKEARNRLTSILMKPISAIAREQRKLRVQDLFTAGAFIDLEGFKFQLVVWNLELAQHQVSNMLLEYENKQISEPVRGKIIFEKPLPKIAKGEAIQDYVDDTLPFFDVFAGHCPPMKITKTHGIGFCMQARLLHPERHTTYSDWLMADARGSDDFLFDDFFEPM